MKITISVGNSRMDRRWNRTTLELDEFRDRISTTRRTAETVAQYRKFTKAAQDNIKDVGGFVMGVLKDGRRRKESVVSRSGLTLDMDYAEPVVLDWIASKGYHLGNVMNAFRLTVVGECKGPHMFDITELLGPDETTARIRRGISAIK